MDTEDSKVIRDFLATIHPWALIELYHGVDDTESMEVIIASMYFEPTGNDIEAKA